MFFQSGATFVFFTDYYADQYNPLIAEFVTQNNRKIGEYPRVDIFFNASFVNNQTLSSTKIDIESFDFVDEVVYDDELYDFALVKINTQNEVKF